MRFNNLNLYICPTASSFGTLGLVVIKHSFSPIL
nr:MAG TPA: hypothetical protein [Caudoviricetes sp.]